MNKVNYCVSDGILKITFQTPKGNRVIECDTMQTPDGDIGVVYDCYSIFLNRIMKNVTDIDYFVGKIDRAVNLLNEGKSLDVVLNTLIREHINQHGRIIDTDLMMMTNVLELVIIAAHGKVNSETLRLQSAGIAMNQYEDKFFITGYHRTPFGIQPDLISANEFMKRK